MTEILNHTYFPLAVFMTCAALSFYMFVSASNSLHTGYRVIAGIGFAVVAFFVAPDAFKML